MVETVLQYACLARKVTRITRGDLQVGEGQAILAPVHSFSSLA